MKQKLIPKGQNGNRIARINEWKQKQGKISKHLIRRPTLPNLLSALSHYMNSTGLMTPPTEVSGVIAETPFVPDVPNAGKLMKVGKIAKAIEDGINNAKSIWKVAAYPGYQLKGLMKGSPLERQLSKNGTININQLNAHFNKASQIERDVINKVLAEKFNGQRIVDYNQLKKAVQDELIGSYNRVQQTAYEDYGIGRLGFKTQIQHDSDAIAYNEQTGEFEQVAPFTQFKPNYTLKTFTFESPRIPYGNNTHYGGNPIGHSRTYTTPEESDILHVMESQSDWAQKSLGLTKAEKTAIQNIDEQLKKQTPTGFSTLEELQVQKQAILDRASQRTQGSSYQAQHLHDNYLQRQLQENLRYAAENGQVKMRYPTPETAAKIEGFQKKFNPHKKELSELRDKIQELWTKYYDEHKSELMNVDFLQLDDIGRRNIQGFSDLRDQYEKLQNIPLQYAPEHQTILQKYADFPKLFQKLYKNQQVINVTDSKGNTWYEVDVPKNYLNSEWQFKQGGILNTKSQTD